MKRNTYIKSPLNYTGGKYKLLSQILPLLPPCNVFFDVFCGGLTVGCNAQAERVVAVDNQCEVIKLYQHWQETPLETTLMDMEVLRGVYGLSKTDADGYLRLRTDYNNNPSSVLFYGLVTTSFSHQIRFNPKGEFNMPFGKNRSQFNPTMRKNLIRFIQCLQCRQFEFQCGDFTEISQGVKPGDLVYCDPPYLLAQAAYNERDGWTDADDLRLLQWLDSLVSRGVGFALSNVFTHRGEVNGRLVEWAQHYEIHHLSGDYSNCSYHSLHRDSPTDEVLICALRN